MCRFVSRASARIIVAALTFAVGVGLALLWGGVRHHITYAAARGDGRLRGGRAK